MSEQQAWLTRVAIYFGVWAAADIAAVLVRFGDITSLFSMPMWLVASVQLVALLTTSAVLRRTALRRA